MASAATKKKSPTRPARKSPKKRSAPALVVPGFARFGGHHCETGAIKNLLGHHGVVAPHSNEPFSEAMLFGVGGGIWFGYMLFEICGAVFVYLGGRANGHSTKADFLGNVCKRLGVRATVKEAGGVRAADRNLRDALAAGRPAICWGAAAGLPYNFLAPELLGLVMHQFLVYGIDDGTGHVLISDRPPTPVTATLDELKIARSRIGSLKNRVLTVTAPKKLADPKKAVRDGIAQCVRSMRKQPIRNFGLQGFHRLAEILTSTRDRKGWPQVFEPDFHLYGALKSVFDAIETGGTGGGAFRCMYADFLDEAAVVLGRPKLRKVARSYRDLRDQWRDLAETALPSKVPAFKKLKALLRKKHDLFQERGTKGFLQIAKINADVARLEAPLQQRFPLGGDEVAYLYGGLRERVEEIHTAEAAALDALEKTALR